MDPQVKMKFLGDERGLTQSLNKIEDAGESSMRTITKSASDAEKALKGVQSAASGIKPVDVKVTADTDKAEGDIRGLADDGHPVDIPVSADTGKAESNIKGLEGHKVDVPVEAETSAAKQALEGLGELGTGIGDEVSGGLASSLKGGIAGAVAGVGSAIISEVADEISASNKIQRSLEKQFKISPDMAKQTSGLFDTNMFEDINHTLGGGQSDQNLQYLEDMGVGADELSATMVRMGQTFKDFSTMSVADQRALTVEMAKTATAAGVDIVDAMKGADTAARVFGLSGWDATRLVDKGFTEMGIRGDDWAETLNEYPRYFQAMGLGADDMERVVKQAMDAGAKDTDHAADAWKEFGIRVVDGSKTTSDALTRLGTDAGEVPKIIAKGGPAARAEIDLLIDRLRAIKDPVEQNRLGVELFGTQWEDTMRGAIGTTDLIAGSTYKWGRSVIEAAEAVTGNGSPALRQMLGDMNNAQLAAEGASVKVDGLGRRVITLPDGKVITLSAKDEASSTITSIANRNYTAVVKLTGVWAGFYGLPNGVVLSGSSARGNAEGGWIDGAGTRTSDSIPRMLSKDEFVVNADDANRGNNPAILEAINSGRSWSSAGPAGMGYSAPSGGGGGSARAITLSFGGNTDGAFASAFMKLVRDGEIQIG